MHGELVTAARTAREPLDEQDESTDARAANSVSREPLDDEDRDVPFAAGVRLRDRE